MPEPYLKYSADQMKFNGYATRYLSPRETGSWRVSEALKVDHSGTGLFFDVGYLSNKKVVNTYDIYY